MEITLIILCVIMAIQTLIGLLQYITYARNGKREEERWQANSILNKQFYELNNSQNNDRLLKESIERSHMNEQHKAVMKAIEWNIKSIPTYKRRNGIN